MQIFNAKCGRATLVALIVVASAARRATGDAAHGSTGATLGKLFDFAGYRLSYGKSYRKMSEEVVRQKCYLARAARAFVSGLAYKRRESGHYLAINQMSDWTPAELRALTSTDFDFDSDSDVGPVLSPDQNCTQIEGLPDMSEVTPVRSPKCAAGPKKFRHFPLSNVVRRAPSDRKWAKRSAPRRARKQTRRDERDTGRGKSVDDNRTLESDAEEEIWEAKLSWLTKGLGKTSKNKRSDPRQAESSSSAVEEQQQQQQDCDDREIFVDHRGECMNEIQDQGDCGACYAFSTIPAFEWLICKRSGRLYKFSEQFVVDCGPESEFGDHFKGCVGGKASLVGKFLAAHGAELISDYPYVQRFGTCPYTGAMHNPTTTGSLRLSGHASLSRKVPLNYFDHYLKFAPIKISIGMGGDFTEYGGGIHAARDCCKGMVTKGGTCGGHGVLIVGHGRENSEHYWLIRNSYSANWGERGYYRLNKNARHCIYDHKGLLLAFDGQRMVLDAYHNDARPAWVGDRIRDMSRYNQRRRFYV